MYWCPLQDLLFWEIVGWVEEATIYDTNPIHYLHNPNSGQPQGAGVSDLSSLLGSFSGQVYRQTKEQASRNEFN